MVTRIIAFVLSCLWATAGLSETAVPDRTLVFLGLSPDAGAPGPLPKGFPAVAFPALPAAEDAAQTVVAARLKANPVSSFVATPGAEAAGASELFLVADLKLLSDGGDVALGLAGEALDLARFTERAAALVGAFGHRHRRIAFVYLDDLGDDAFPGAVFDLKAALGGAGFDMTVLMVDAGRGTECGPRQALHLSITSGLADRQPFGDGDGLSTSAEVERYLTQAVRRQVARGDACAPRYSVILKAAEEPGQTLVTFAGRAPFDAVEAALFNESFEAQVLLASGSSEEVEAYLARCLYCPHEPALTAHLAAMADAERAGALEAQIWAELQADETPERLAVYLETCRLCAYRDKAGELIALLDAKAAARASERQRFEAARAARDLGAMREYAEGCVACDDREEARALVTEIEADAAYQAEVAALDAALAARDIDLLQAYIDGCTICEGKDRAMTALVDVTQRIRLIDPCLAAAAVPQLGGPRQLTQIDQAVASRSCEAALAAFPEEPQLQITLGRIAQAAGDFDRALGHYTAGMDAQLPAAFGLAAYTHYAPPEGQEINLTEAERLAQIGAEKGDWLSREILTVLYSRGLVPGRTNEEAFEVAMGLAEEGNPMAHYFVGYYYLNGTGVEEDLGAAKTWLQKAVDAGFVLAMSSLAEVYESADVPDTNKAAALYWSALQAGDETALDHLTAQISSRNREVIRVIQTNLAELGKYRGPLDGIPGGGTVRAIRAFADSVEQG